MIGTLLARRAVARAFDAMNRHDLATFMAPWGDDGVFVYPGDVPESGTFNGKPAVERWFRHFFEQFPTIQFDLQDVCVRNCFDLVGTNTVAVHWRLRLVNRDGAEGRNSGVTVISLAHGKVTRVQDFLWDLGKSFRRNWGVTTQPQ